MRRKRGIVCLHVHYSTLQCNPRERERERAHHDWLAESKQERQGVCSPTSNWVSTLLSVLHLIFTAYWIHSLHKPNNRSVYIRSWYFIVAGTFNYALRICVASFWNWNDVFKAAHVQISISFLLFEQTHPELDHFCEKSGLHQTRKKHLATSCDSGAVVRSCGHSCRRSCFLCRWGRSAFGTARLPVRGQLNTAWDWALKACPERSEVLCALVCVCRHASLCVLEHQCAMAWLNLMNQQWWEGWRFQYFFLRCYLFFYFY